MKLSSLIVLILLSFSYCLSSNEFKMYRVDAVKLIKEGSEKNNIRLIYKGIRQMESLSKKGDVESMFALGRIYLSGKSIEKDLSKSFKWFYKAGQLCHQQSLEVLNKFFLNRKSSQYFSPFKYNQIINYCDNEVVLNKPKTRSKRAEKKIPKKNQKASLHDWSVNQSKVNIIDTDGKLRKGLEFRNTGSAFAVNKKGYFLTNRHVVKDCSIVTIKYNNYINYAKIVKISKNMDAALLKTEANTPYHAHFDVNKYKVGEKLYAAGFPGIISEKTDSYSMSLSEGNITNIKIIENSLDKYMIVSVPMSSGNSGGPIINSYGLLRGMSLGGFDEAMLVKEHNVFIGGMTVNVMVPGISLKEWLDYNLIRVDEKSRNIRMNAEEIGEMADRVVGLILCFKYE